MLTNAFFRWWFWEIDTLFWSPRVGDKSSRNLASRLRASAEMVPEPQRSRILSRMPGTVFVSHTSRDKELIGGPVDGLVLHAVSDYFYDPFLHNIGMGAASEYEKVVGLALQASRRVLAVWSRNAQKSDYVRAELLIASQTAKHIVAYLGPGAPRFPIPAVNCVSSLPDMKVALAAWKNDSHPTAPQ